MERRTFIKKSIVAGAAYAGVELTGYAMPRPAYAVGTGGGIDVAEGLHYLEEGKEKNVQPRVRAEIADNPRAVFLIDTSVEATRDDRGFFSDARSQLESEGTRAARLIFARGDERGGSTIVRPNFTTVPDDVLSPVVGINTSSDFVAGFIEGLRELGNTNVITSARGTDAVNHRKTGIYDSLDRHEIRLIEANYQRFSDYDKKELNWHRVPGTPQVWKRIPTYRPIGDPDNLFINMPKLKCHNLGLTTLAIKNLQGVVPSGYGHFCNRWSMMEALCRRSYEIDFNRNFVKDYYQNVESAFLRHRAAGFKHWDVENAYAAYERKGGWNAFRKAKDSTKDINEFMQGVPGALMWDEQWCQRATDCASAIVPDLNIIEGIIGRDGSGFDLGRDELCNVLVVGSSMVEVDAVGSYLMGHDPTELPYTRIAKERGLGECDAEQIDIYRVSDTGIRPVRDLTTLRRSRLGVNIHSWAESGRRLFW